MVTRNSGVGNVKLRGKRRRKTNKRKTKKRKIKNRKTKKSVKREYIKKSLRGGVSIYQKTLLVIDFDECLAKVDFYNLLLRGSEYILKLLYEAKGLTLDDDTGEEKREIDEKVMNYLDSTFKIVNKLAAADSEFNAFLSGASESSTFISALMKRLNRSELSAEQRLGIRFLNKVGLVNDSAEPQYSADFLEFLEKFVIPDAFIVEKLHELLGLRYKIMILTNGRCITFIRYLFNHVIEDLRETNYPLFRFLGLFDARRGENHISICAYVGISTRIPKRVLFSFDSLIPKAPIKERVRRHRGRQLLTLERPEYDGPWLDLEDLPIDTAPCQQAQFEASFLYPNGNKSEFLKEHAIEHYSTKENQINKVILIDDDGDEGVTKTKKRSYKPITFGYTHHKFINSKEVVEFDGEKKDDSKVYFHFCQIPPKPWAKQAKDSFSCEKGMSSIFLEDSVAFETLSKLLNTH